MIIGSNVHTSVYDKRDDFRRPIVISPGWLTRSLDSNRTVFTFPSLFDLRDVTVVLAFWISILKIFK